MQKQKTRRQSRFFDSEIPETQSQSIDDEIEFTRSTSKRKAKTPQSSSKKRTKGGTDIKVTKNARMKLNFDKNKRVSTNKNAIKVGNLGTYTLEDLKTYKNMVHPEALIPKAVFLRVVKQIIREIQPEFRLSKDALAIIQEVTEREFSNLFYISNLLSLMSSKNTVRVGHLKMAAGFKKISSNGVDIDSQFDMHSVLQDLGVDLQQADLGSKIDIDELVRLSQAIIKKKEKEKRREVVTESESEAEEIPDSESDE
jgi:histone H3/H4